MVKQINSMKALIVTNEFPPDVYGGAGVHVDYLTRELRKLIQVEVRCFGSQRTIDKNLDVYGFDIDNALFTSCPKELKPALSACYRSIGFTAKKIDAHVIHCHTWYTHLAGILAKYCYGIPLIITIHSLEPLRPWKREQLGRGYDLSCWVEKTAIEMADAVIAVSEGTKQDVLNNFNVEENKIHVIYNGIDTNEYSYVDPQDALDKYGIDKNRPYVLFVGRITRQKGILHLVNAIPFIDPHIQIVLCAGSPDTIEIAEEWFGNLGAHSSCPGDGKGIVHQRHFLSNQGGGVLCSKAGLAMSCDSRIGSPGPRPGISDGTRSPSRCRRNRALRRFCDYEPAGCGATVLGMLVVRVISTLLLHASVTDDVVLRVGCVSCSPLTTRSCSEVAVS